MGQRADDPLTFLLRSSIDDHYSRLLHYEIASILERAVRRNVINMLHWTLSAFTKQRDGRVDDPNGLSCAVRRPFGAVY